MKQCKIILAGFLFVLATGDGWAQEPVPLPPYLKAAPEMSAWIIEWGKPKSTSSPETKTAGSTMPGPEVPATKGSREVRQIKVIRTKTLRLVSVTYTGGEHDELWSDGTTFIEKSSEAAPFVSTIALYPITLLDDYHASDFPDFTWVSKANFVNTVELDGQRCFLFSRKTAGKAPMRNDMLKEKSPTEAPPEEIVMAWIDASTRLPVQWRRGDEIHRVTFTAAPAGLLTFPSDVAEVVGQMRKLQQITNMRAPAGG